MRKSIILFLLSIFMLVGCDNIQYKSKIQSSFDYRKGKMLCYSLSQSHVTFPVDSFVEEPVFNVFVELDFLQSKPISIKRMDGSFIQGERYSITKEGRKYYQKDQNGFCFGSVIVDEIYNSDDIEFKQFGSRTGTGKWLYYNYYFSDIPDWAKEAKLAEFYNIVSLDEQRLHSERATYSNQDGSLSSGISNIMIQLKSIEN